MKFSGLPVAGFLIIASQATTVPVDQEPKHKVVFKNEFARVLDATLPAGYVTLNHAHAADNVSVTISNGREGEAALRGIGRAGFSKGGYSHTVSNPGPGVMRYIVVEPFKSDRPNAAATTLPHHTVETENDKVRIYRVKLESDEALEANAHTSEYVEVTVAGPGGSGASSWIAAGENRPQRTPVSGTATETVEIEPK